ncbi:MAG: LacI family DNA-binding transcriptional regulator, partial [Chloroflexota bacterium]
MNDKRVTSIDVARRAGVSQSTVSRVFSPSANVSDDKRERVLAAAAELGYTPNAIARSLSRQQTDIIGLVMADLTSPFYPYVLDKFLTRLQGMGKQVLLFTVSDAENLDDVLPLIMQHRVDALVITSATLSSEMTAACVRMGIPVILFNRYVRGGDVSSVCCDNYVAGRDVADLLLDSGHQRLAYIAGKPNTSTNTDRERGFRERIAEGDAPAPQILSGSYTYDSGYYGGRSLLLGESVPEAIFCANDIMAVGCLDAARDLGVSVPEDLSVVGFDDIPMAGWSAYDLTTVRHDDPGDEPLHWRRVRLVDFRHDQAKCLVDHCVDILP